MTTGKVGPKVGKIVDLPVTSVGGPVFDYIATSNPGSITATGSTSPITFSGLTVGTSYTFTVASRNASGTSPLSSASNSVAPSDYPLAFESIATVSVGSGGAASAEFTSIPGTYTHLQVRIFAKTDRALNRDGVRMRMNSVSTGSPYAWHGLYGDGASALTDGGANLNEIVTFRAAGDTSATSIWGGLIIDVLDYANTNKNTTIRCLGG
ncbi:hypothetical protein EBU71_14385, partial [bacterium]|nr:hypothetical protein [Candidatus Elulimicrobium humile]